MTSKIQLTAPLTAEEQEALLRHELVIAGAWMQVGASLLQIRANRLYRDYGSFKTYCEERWGMTLSRAKQIISGVQKAEYVQEVTGVTLPNEAAARKLNRVPYAYQPSVVTIAHRVAQSEGKPLTSSHLGAAWEVLKEVMDTGAVSDGTGESTLIGDAVKDALRERRARQRGHINASRGIETVVWGRAARIVEVNEQPCVLMPLTEGDCQRFGEATHIFVDVKVKHDGH